MPPIGWHAEGARRDLPRHFGAIALGTADLFRAQDELFKDLLAIIAVKIEGRHQKLRMISGTAAPRMAGAMIAKP